MNRSQTSNAFFRTMADSLVAISSPVTESGGMTILVRTLIRLPRAVSRER
jgi:hypothetical protein